MQVTELIDFVFGIWEGYRKRRIIEKLRMQTDIGVLHYKMKSLRYTVLNIFIISV